MKFHLSYTPPRPGFEISHSDKLVLIGSCFSENIGKLLNDHKFKTYSNPSGILFNPLSIAHSLNGSLSTEKFDNKYILQRDHSFFSYLHHSSINSASEEELIKAIDLQNQEAFRQLKEADFFIITFGTAYYYHHVALNETVANCHKQPGSEFEKRLLSTTEIVSVYSDLIQRLQNFNPALKIIFTVSPVKHLKDGLVENTISKSALHLSIHELIKKHSNCFYFPAYELVSDDLRDYRFYKPDLAHPNEQAIDYVWQKFSECYFSDKTQLLNQKIQQLNRVLQHTTLHENKMESEKLQAFISEQKKQILSLFPDIRF